MSKLKIYFFIIILFLGFKIDAQEYSIDLLTTKNGLPSNIVYDIQQDTIGYLWIATAKGLVKYDGVDFKLINKQKTLTLYVDGQTVYAGQENGLFIKNKSIEKFYRSKTIVSILKIKNEIITGTIEGLYSLKNDDLLPLKINSDIDSSSINDLISEKNDILIASSNGLYKIHKKLNINSLALIKYEYFIAIDKSYNGCIAAKLNHLIFEIQNDSIQKTINTFSKISAVKKLRNEVWVASKTNGIEIYTLPSFSFKRKINKYNSLQTNAINNIFRSSNNATYISTDEGIYILKNTTFKNNSKPKPIVYFENVQVNHQNVDTLLSVKRLKLSYSENNIAISFKTVDLSSPKKIQYRYSLNGKFSPWSTNNTVQFPNLKTGKYEFQVQSKVNDQVSNLKLLSFIIDTPFYMQAWFIFSVVISLLLLAYFSLDYYIKRIQKISQQKIGQLKLKNRLISLEQKALQLQMNPHFIFNVLNGIKALGNKGDTQELNNTISKFSVLLRGILNNSRKEEITLQEEIKLLRNYIDLEQRMSTNTFKYSISTDLNNIDSEEILIPTMLIQPFIENCIQHAFEKNTHRVILIKFYIKHRFLYCSIIDNGIGIYQSQKRKGETTHKSIALKVSKERLTAINSKCSLEINEIIENDQINGTQVIFRIPLKTDY